MHYHPIPCAVHSSTRRSWHSWLQKARYLSLDDSTMKRYVYTYKLPLAVMLQRDFTLKGEPGPWWPP